MSNKTLLIIATCLYIVLVMMLPISWDYSADTSYCDQQYKDYLEWSNRTGRYGLWDCQPTPLRTGAFVFNGILLITTLSFILEEFYYDGRVVRRE